MGVEAVHRTEAETDGEIRDLWDFLGDDGGVRPSLVMRPAVYWELRWFVGLPRWRRLAYRLFPNKRERDLSAFLRAHGVDKE